MAISLFHRVRVKNRVKITNKKGEKNSSKVTVKQKIKTIFYGWKFKRR